MEFSIGMQVSREITFEDSKVVDVLNESLNNYFKNKEYGDKIKKIYIGVICVSIGFEPFLPIRPLKIIRKEPAIEYEIKIDFIEFKDRKKDKRLELLFNTFFNETLKIVPTKNIKGFDLEKFKVDLELWFYSIKF